VRLPALRRVTEQWRPDLIVHDPADFAAPLVAESLGVRSIQHSWGPAIPLVISRVAATAMEPAWRSAGLQPDVYGGMYRGLYIDVCPPALQVPDWQAPGRVMRMRPV